MKLLSKIFALSLFAVSSYGAQFYVDAAASGSNNGTSWANAWTSFNSINYNAINPGDFINISQGQYGSLNPAKSGTQNAPITFRVARDVGHNGGFTNTYIQVGQNWITFDGSLSDSYGPANITNTLSTTNLYPNIGWHIISTNSAQVNGGGTCSDCSATFGVVYRWIEMMQLSDFQEDYGIRYNSPSPHIYNNNEVGYCWIHNVGQDGIKNAGGSSVTNFDATIIHHCLIELIGDDGVELNDGYTVANCIIRNARDEINRGHPDGIAGQTWSWSKYYNNIVWGFRRSQCFYPNTLIQSNKNLYIYGNLVYWGDTNANQFSKGVASIGEEDLYWDPKYGHIPGSSDTNIYWENIRVFNNSFMALNPYSTQPWAINNRYKNGWTSDSGKWCTVWVTNMVYYNNCFYAGVNAAFGVAQNVFVATNRLVLGFNNGWSSVTAGKGFGCDFWSYTTAEAMDAGQGFIGDNSIQPTFISPNAPNWNYTPSTLDTALRNKGTNLTVYVSSMPGLDVDLAGTQRDAGGTWDIGALEVGISQPETNLLVWLRMTNDFSINGGTIVDSSGNGNDFKRYGLIGESYPSNSIVSAFGTDYTGSRTGQVAKVWETFLQDPDPRAAFETGTWMALTNIWQFTNLTQFTFAFWAAMDSQRNNYSATILDFGNNYYGCQTIGRWFDMTPTNNFHWTITTNFDSVAHSWDRCTALLFPNDQRTYANKWCHYAGTFSNGVCRIFFNGTNCGSTTLWGGITNLTVFPASANEDTTQGYLGNIMMGCRNHNGNPYIASWTNNTDYPNNGWASGEIDDVRMYNRVLSDSEIANLASFTPPQNPDPTISAQPQDVSILAGQNATFSVTAAGTSPFSYQWRINGITIAGATQSSYTRTAVPVAENGSKMDVIVNNSIGSITSSQATMNVGNVPTTIGSLRVTNIINVGILNIKGQ